MVTAAKTADIFGTFLEASRLYGHDESVLSLIKKHGPKIVHALGSRTSGSVSMPELINAVGGLRLSEMEEFISAVKQMSQIGLLRIDERSGQILIRLASDT